MFVSMNWINEFVDLSGENTDELIRRFTLSTAEVEDVYYKGRDISGVIIAQIVSVQNHPNSKKLHLLKVDTGKEILDVVCGAPNVSEGQKVALATVGARLPAGEIGVATIAGYTSFGMCCASDELGLSDDHSGLMFIDPDAPLGADIKDVYPIDDVVFEVDNKSLTNRPDLWGHYGIAREFAAITGKKLKPLELAEIKYDGNNIIPIKVMRSDLLYRYCSLQISGISKTVSPVAMQIRLYYCGMRGINLLADLTNYVMLELGQPMHAFDGRKVQEIGVGTPAEELEFRTLDGIDRKITPDTLMIYNNNIPVAIAGIMGGLDSEIIGDTSTVVLESANFDGISVRKTSSRLGLRTDASMRYEKILDPELCDTASRRFVRLLSGIDGGAFVSSKLNDVYVNRYPVRRIEFDKKYVDRYTGIDISEERIVGTLDNLGFDVSRNGESFTVTVPTWRATKDVTIKADIIEEITRIYGYDNFAIGTTKSLLKPVRSSVSRSDCNSIKNILVQRFGLHEVHSYIWQDGKKYKKLGIDVEDNVRILNIPTPENGTLRRSMIPTLLSIASENKGFSDNFGIFEIGRVVHGLRENGECDEKSSLGIVLYSKTASEKQLFDKLAGILRTMAEEIKHTAAVFERTYPEHRWEHPKNTFAVSAGGIKIAAICTLHPANLSKIDKTASVVCAEVDADLFCSVPEAEVSYTEPSKFPGIDIDLSLVIPEGKAFRDAENCWSDMLSSPITSARVIDVYDGIAGAKSVTVRFTFSSDDRTLSMNEVQLHVDKIIGRLDENGIHIRG